MKARPPDYPLVLVEWLDSARGTVWADTHEVRHHSSPIFSVGWLYKLTKELVVIVPHASLDAEEDRVDQIVGDMAIPRRAVIRIRYLRRKRLR